MNADVYGAWLTAGNNLHQAVEWAAANFPNLAVAAVLAVFAAWCIRRALRNASHKVDAILADLDNQPREENL